MTYVFGGTLNLAQSINPHPPNSPLPSSSSLSSSSSSLSSCFPFSIILLLFILFFFILLFLSLQFRPFFLLVLLLIISLSSSSSLSSSLSSKFIFLCRQKAAFTSADLCMAGPSVQPNKMEQMHCALLTRSTARPAMSLALVGPAVTIYWLIDWSIHWLIVICSFWTLRKAVMFCDIA